MPDPSTSTPTVPATSGGEPTGAAPHRSEAFNTMANALTAALKGKSLPTPTTTTTPAPAKSEAKPPADAKPAAEPAPTKPLPDKLPKFQHKEEKSETPTLDDPILDSPNYVPSRENWKQFRQALKEHKTKGEEFSKLRGQIESELAAAKAEVQKLKATPPAPAIGEDAKQYKDKLEALEKERGEMETELRRLKLIVSPEFGGHFKKQEEAALAFAKANLPTEQHENLDTLIGMKPGKLRSQLLDDVADGLSDSQKIALHTALLNLDRAKLERQSELDNEKQNFERLQQMQVQKQQEAAQAQEAEIEQAIRFVSEHATKNFKAFQANGEDAASAERVKANLGRIEAFIRQKLPLEEALTLPLYRAEFDVLAEEHKKVAAELEETKKALAALQSSGASLAGSTTKASEGESGQTFKDRVLKHPAWKRGY